MEREKEEACIENQDLTGLEKYDAAFMLPIRRKKIRIEPGADEAMGPFTQPFAGLSRLRAGRAAECKQLTLQKCRPHYTIHFPHFVRFLLRILPTSIVPTGFNSFIFSPFLHS